MTFSRLRPRFITRKQAPVHSMRKRRDMGKGQLGRGSKSKTGPSPRLPNGLAHMGAPVIPPRRTTGMNYAYPIAQYFKQ